MGFRFLLCLGLPLLLASATALAGEGSLDASERVYEAADAIDAARAEVEDGRAEEADRLLAQAESLLKEAAKLDPELARVGYELARIHLIRKSPLSAEQALTRSMRLDLPTGEHVRMAELLDTVRSDLGRPRLGVQWKRDTALRDAGVGALAGGAAVAAIGMAIAYISFVGATEEGVTDENLATNRFGWALAGVGGGIAVGGGAMTVIGQVRLDGLRRILPGPWRLASDERSASFVLALRWSIP
jgi:hypothetical protein